jgi:RNA polymerase sporulation-specific sigma factor
LVIGILDCPWAPIPNLLIYFLLDPRRFKKLTSKVSLTKIGLEGVMAQIAELITQNLGLVGYIVKQYLGRGVKYAELFSAGRQGLIEAANRFKPDKGAKFSVYAGYWIRRRIKEDLKCLSPVESLNEEATSVDLEGPSLDDRIWLEGALSRLDEGDRQILTLCFGLDQKGERSLKEAAGELGISPQAVSKRKEQAIKDLRRLWEGKPVQPRPHPSGLSRQDYLCQYRQEYHEQLKEQIRSWWQEHPGYYKRWLSDHPGYHKSWRLKNLDHCRQYEREYKRRRRHPMSIKKRKLKNEGICLLYIIK